MSPEWLVEDWYNQNGLHLLGGPVGSGKTGLEIGLLAAAFRGRLWMGKQTFKPTKWVQIVSDRGLDNRTYWAKQHHIELPGPHESYVVADHPYDRPDLMGKTVTERMKASTAWLASKLIKLGPLPGGVVTIDVATPFFPPSHADYGVGFWAGQELRAMLREFPSCYLLLSHGAKYNKFTSASRLVDRIIGNTGLLGVMDTLSYIGTQAEASDIQGFPKGCQIFSVLPRMAKESTLALRRDALGCFTVAPGATTEAQDGSDLGAPRKLTLETLVGYFSEVPKSRLDVQEEIVSQEGVTARTVQRRFSEAVDEELLQEAQGGWIRL